MYLIHIISFGLEGCLSIGRAVSKRIVSATNGKASSSAGKFFLQFHLKFPLKFPLLAISGALWTGCACSAQPVHSAQIELFSADQKAFIEAETLKVDWQRNGETLSINQAGLKVNGEAQRAEVLDTSSLVSATWRLLPSRIVVRATMGYALDFSFSLDPDTAVRRNEPVRLEWFDLAASATKTLYLPFNEGMRVPTADKMWREYLTQTYSGSNTTQDLKMPFWTAEQNGQFINYTLVTPSNNRLEFSSESDRTDMLATHEFTALNFRRPFNVRITWGEGPLSGALDYRRWRQEQELAEPLSAKLAKNPAVQKLIGASHVYLFGNHVLAVEDVRDWWGLREWYFDQSQLMTDKQDTAELRELQALQQGKDWLSQYHKRLLVESVNASLNMKFPARSVTLEDNGIESQFQAAQKRKEHLAENAGQYLLPAQEWGQALSQGMIAKLQQAGLTKLWLGLDNWMPAFYQPDAVEEAKRAGYAIATYDSYNTAIEAGVNDSWLTAQLPDEMRTGCAIEKADGSKKKGFRGKGYYLNPACQREYVERRILDIVKYGRFDSLFLDVDATAMAREDYHADMDESTMLEAFNDRMNWIGSQQGILLGSESGNAITTHSLAFAHGMETNVFGWNDEDMHANRQSPYFLGAWYPDHKPDIFFKPVQVKEPYKTLLFAPQFRIPLYQAVFHDEVISSHHWHTDSLKFSDVQAARDLIAMLYNTPPMVHLSRDEVVSPDSPRLRALQHYQDGFQPIHEQLWDKALVDFEWLDAEGNLQQTTFSDGSKIIANFSAVSGKEANGHNIPAQSILARLNNGQQLLWTVEEFH